jgi:hypothetical protein
MISKILKVGKRLFWILLVFYPLKENTHLHFDRNILNLRPKTN